MTTMVDGITEDVPAILQHFGSSTPVACYVNGIYAWTHAQEAEFGRKVRISVEPGQPEAARVARVLDVERGAATLADIEPFLRARTAAGHSDATIYCNLSTVMAAKQAAGALIVPRWWIAWYWGRPGAPAEGDVRTELRDLTGTELPAGSLWACQYASHAQWDLSVVYGQQDWSR